MKALAIAAAVVALAGPSLAFAQSTNAPVTRAQVRADLVQLERAGYSPSSGSDAHYPDDILAAEATVSASDASVAASAMGGVMPGTSASGAPMHARGAMPGRCVGPQSFCQIYFGS